MTSSEDPLSALRNSSCDDFPSPTPCDMKSRKSHSSEISFLREQDTAPIVTNTSALSILGSSSEALSPSIELATEQGLEITFERLTVAEGPRPHGKDSLVMNNTIDTLRNKEKTVQTMEGSNVTERSIVKTDERNHSYCSLGLTDEVLSLVNGSLGKANM